MPVYRLRVAVQDVTNPSLAIAALPHRETLGKVNAVFDVVDKAHCNFPLFIYRRVLAGMAGFGPAHYRFKAGGLTAWRHPRSLHNIGGGTAAVTIHHARALMSWPASPRRILTLGLGYTVASAATTELFSPAPAHVASVSFH